jgi:hypothetical protein
MRIDRADVATNALRALCIVLALGVVPGACTFVDNGPLVSADSQQSLYYLDDAGVEEFQPGQMHPHTLLAMPFFGISGFFEISANGRIWYTSGTANTRLLSFTPRTSRLTLYDQPQSIGWGTATAPDGRFALMTLSGSVEEYQGPTRQPLRKRKIAKLQSIHYDERNSH